MNPRKAVQAGWSPQPLGQGCSGQLISLVIPNRMQCTLLALDVTRWMPSGRRTRTGTLLVSHFMQDAVRPFSAQQEDDASSHSEVRRAQVACSIAMNWNWRPEYRPLQGAQCVGSFLMFSEDMIRLHFPFAAMGMLTT